MRAAGLPADERWLLIAGSSEVAARRFAAEQGLSDVRVVALEELVAAGPRALRVLRSAGASAVAVHTLSWPTQRHARLLELALACIRARVRAVVDEETGSVRLHGRPRLAAAALLLPAEALLGLAGAAAEIAAFHLRRGRSGQCTTRCGGERAVLAIWLGEPGVAVGGAVTHAAGILGGFRRAGYRVGLVTEGPLPSQLERVVDDVERLRPARPGARFSRDVHGLARNRRVREAAGRLARRLAPAFVYQRHAAYLVAGVDVAHDLGVPLVLEWNAAESWTRARWQRRLPLEGCLTLLLAPMERHVAARASAVTAVSDEAARMALEASAPAERTRVVPNGVDLAAVDGAVAGAALPAGGAKATIGWIGSFGPWHGAEVAVRALCELPDEVEAVLVGEGRERAACERLARELGVAERVRFPGALPHGEALRTLAPCDVLVSPHVPIPGQPFFGSPTKLFEYMALGRPIVASRLGQLAEVLEDGRTAVLVEPGDPSALAEGVRRVLARHDRGESLAAGARAEAARAHTWDSRAEAVLGTLDGARGAEDVDAGTPARGPARAVPRTPGPTRRRAAALLGSRAVRQAALFACSAALVGLLVTVSRATLARTLSPAEFGGFVLATSALLLLALVFEFGLLFPAGRAVACRKPRERGEIVGAALLLYLPVGAAFCLAVVALSYAVGAWFDAQAGEALRVTAPLAFVYPFQQLALWLAQGADRLHVYSLSAAAGQLLFAGGLATLLAFEVGLTLPVALAAQAAALLVGWTPLVALLHPSLRAGTRRVRGLLADARSFGVHAYTGRLLSMGTYNMDVVLVAALADVRAVAVYGIAVTVARAAGLAMQGMGAALFPRLARDARIERRWLVAAWGIGLAAAAALTVAGEPLARLVFSDRYDVGVALLAPLAFAEAIRGVTTLYNSALSAQGRGHELRNAGLALTTANLTLNLTLIPAFGATGAAWASLGALVVNLLAHLAYYHRTLRLSPPLAPASPEAGVPG